MALETAQTLNALTIREVADIRGISRRNVLKAIQKGRLPGAFQIQNPDGTPTWLIPISSLQSPQSPAVETESAPSPALPPPIPVSVKRSEVTKGAEAALAAIGLDPDLEADVRAMLRKRGATVLAFRDLRCKKDGTAAVQRLKAAWANVGGRIATRWPSEAELPSIRTLYRAANEFRGGDDSVLLGRIQPRLDRRQSSTLGTMEAEVE